MPTNFVLGFLFVWLGKHEVARSSEVLSFPVKVAWLFSALIFCPITGWSFYAYPAWATVYLRTESMIPPWTGPVIVSFYFLGMVFGSLLAQHFIRLRKPKWFFFTLALGIYWLITMTIMTWDEYQHIGTFAMYHSGQALPIKDSPEFMQAMNIMGALIGLPGVLLAAYVFKRSQKYKLSA